MPEIHVPSRPIRVLTAAALFDGHDAAINIMRRILQSQGAEVIHLGHNRSVDEIALAALQEDVDAIAVSSYQGGHVEFFEYLVRTLTERGADHMRVYGGGGGTIVPAEIDSLHGVGVARIFAPEDGQRLGLAAMVNTILVDCDQPRLVVEPDLAAVASGDTAALAGLITGIESGRLDDGTLLPLRERAAASPAVVLGITGTGGAGKSSLTDELIHRLRLDQDDKLRTAVIAIDPSRRCGGRSRSSWSSTASGPRDEREPPARIIHRRRADRSGRGGGARRVRPDHRTRRRTRRDGNRLPARPDPGRVDALRAAQARRLAADHRREHLPRPGRRSAASAAELARGTDEEKRSQLDRLADFHTRNREAATVALGRLRAAVTSDENVFAELMSAARVCSLGQITDAFFEVGGQYRRNV